MFPSPCISKSSLKAFIKPFEALQRSVEIKIKLAFSLFPGMGRKRLNNLRKELNLYEDRKKSEYLVMIRGKNSKSLENWTFFAVCSHTKALAFTQ